MGISTNSAIRVGTPYRRIDRARAKRIARLIVNLHPRGKSAHELLSIFSDEESKDLHLYFRHRWADVSLKAETDLSVLFTTETVAGTPTAWIDQKVEYWLILLSQWMKGLRKTNKSPEGLHLGLIFVGDKLASFLLHTLAFPFKLLTGVLWALGGVFSQLCSGLWAAFHFRFGGFSQGLRNCLISFIPLADTLIKLPVLFMMNHPYWTVAFVCLALVSVVFPTPLVSLVTAAGYWLGANLLLPIGQFFASGLTSSNPWIFGGTLISSLASVTLSFKFLGNILRHSFNNPPSVKNQVAQALLTAEDDTLLDAIEEAYYTTKHQNAIEFTGHYETSTPQTMHRQNTNYSRQTQEAVRQSLMQKFNHNTSLVNKYMKFIKANKKMSDAKIFRRKSNLPSSVMKINGQHYLFEKKLGSGYCGTAKKALHLETNSSIVVKVVKPVENIYGSMLDQITANEQRILRHLNKNPSHWSRTISFGSFGLSSLHKPSNISRIAHAQSKTYTTLPFEAGIPANEYAQNEFTLETCEEFMLSILTALNDLHDQNVFHGDIKLENIIFNPETGKSVFIDLGLSQLVDAQGFVKECSLFHPVYALANSKRQVAGEAHMRSPEWNEGLILGVDTEVYAAGLMLNDFLDKVKLKEGNVESLRTLLHSMTVRDRSKRPPLNEIIRALAPKQTLSISRSPH